MSTMQDEPAASQLPAVLVNLLRGVVYREQTPDLWRDLERLQGPARDTLRLLGLELLIDDSEGYAYLRQLEADAEDSGPAMPRLIARRPLSYPVSLLLVQLRKRLAQHDATSGDTRLVLSRDHITDLMRTFLPSGSNEARIVDQIERHIARVEELGFLRRLKADEELYEVRRILRAFVDADWLAALETTYRDYAARDD